MILSDRYNNDNLNNKYDDIDEFFAQFDKQEAADNKRSSSPGQARHSNHVHSGSSKSDYDADPMIYASRSSESRGNRTHRSDARRSGLEERRAQESESGRSERSARRAEKTRSSENSESRTHRAKRALTSVVGSAGSGRNGKSGRKNALKAAGFVFLGIVMAVGIYAGVIFAATPSIDTSNIYDSISQRSIIYDSDGNEIDNLYLSDGNRTLVDYEDIPEDMVNAVVSIEDKKFWSHNGFNFIRMVGAIKDSVVGGSQISGTSTVTQQLARNVYLSEIKGQRSLTRKLSEAYYTIILEKDLSKEEIMEAYLNTIYLGFNAYGVQAAAQTYFSKDVQDLDALECVSLAALPQSPDTYALVKADYTGENSSSLPTISGTDSVTYLYNGDISSSRRTLILNSMEASGYITSDELSSLLEDDLKDHINVNSSDSSSTSSYFADYVIEQVTQDLVSEYGISRSDAQNMIYTGGLKIYTTLDSSIQSIVEEEFEDDSNFTTVSSFSTNSSGDILSDSGSILLYAYSNYFNDDDQFTLESDEYEMNDDGSMTIYAGNRLNIYETESSGETDISIEFKGMYTRENSSFYFIENGTLSIPQQYKTTDSDGNVVISADFFTDYPDFFVASGDSYVVNSENYTLKQKVRQPQAAIVIMENSTGEIKAMMGGRGTSGKYLYNRATSTRQPGSSIKPISVYGPALQMSYEYEKEGRTMDLSNSDGSNWGDYITAGSVINDAQMTVNGEIWPKNSYSGYKGQVTLRTAVQQSINTCAVKVFQNVGTDYSTSMLKKVGITSIVEDGDTNDMNAASLALGGLTDGISPLELTAAYATFPNGGEYQEAIAYTKVLDSNDEVKLEKVSESEQVYDEGVAWIMTDILRTVVSEGIGSSAAISNQPVGGKTGTTSNKYDIWFAGFTPQYTAALWMGNDINLELSDSSGKAASFWSAIMSRVCEDLPTGSFGEQPSNVVKENGEYYTEGTYTKVSLSKSTTSLETNTTELPTTTEETTNEQQTTTQQETTTEQQTTEQQTTTTQ